MAQIVITLQDNPDGLVDVNVYLGGEKGPIQTPAQKLAMDMLNTGKHGAYVSDVREKAATEK